MKNTEEVKAETAALAERFATRLRLRSAAGRSTEEDEDLASLSASLAFVAAALCDGPKTRKRKDD